MFDEHEAILIQGYHPNILYVCLKVFFFHASHKPKEKSVRKSPIDSIIKTYINTRTHFNGLPNYWHKKDVFFFEQQKYKLTYTFGKKVYNIANIVVA